MGSKNATKSLEITLQSPKYCRNILCGIMKKLSDTFFDFVSSKNSCFRVIVKVESLSVKPSGVGRGFPKFYQKLVFYLLAIGHVCHHISKIFHFCSYNVYDFR